MPFAAGTFARLYRWVTEAGAPPIEIAKLDEDGDDVATALSNCILRDGTGVPSADIPWNGKKITGLADPTAAQDAATKAYADGSSGSFTATLTGGFTGAVTGTVKYLVSGGVATLWCEANISGTSNSNSLAVSGLPSAVRPTGIRSAPAGPVFAGAVTCPSIISFALGLYTEFSIGRPVVSGADVSSSPNFPSSGLKGLAAGWTVSYPL